MDITVVICTYNRANELQKTLASLTMLDISPNIKWELIVVDNHCLDATAEICEKYEVKIPLRRIVERQQGQNHALNRAIPEAQADLIAFTDDDVDFDTHWLNEIVAAATRYPDISFFGGKVLSRWQSQPPRWFAENAEMLRSNPRVNLGDQEIVISQPGEGKLIGANLILRRRALTDETFRADVGPMGDGMAGGRVGAGELDLEERLLRKGYAGLYLPKAIVFHRDPAYRMTEKYIRHWYREAGKRSVRTDNSSIHAPKWFGAPRYLWREVLENAAKYAVCRYFAPSRFWLSAECRLCTAWGKILEYRTLARKAKAE